MSASAARHQEAASPHAAPPRWLPLVAISLGSCMLLLDVTIVNVALPRISHDLHASFSSVQWVINAYALALAALMLSIGALADRLGHRRVYVGALAVFAAASAVCGAAPTVTVLDVARAVQGVGGAAMFATTVALLNSTYQGPERGRAFGTWAAISSAAIALGPIFGGALVTISWRWIFYVNLPLSIVTIVLTLRVMPIRAGNARRRIDGWGTASFAVFAATLTYALIRTGEHGWGAATCALIAVAAAALAAFVAIELRTAAPMLDLGLFRQRFFVGTMLASLVVNLSAFAALTYSSIWLQTVLGLSPLEAGLTGLPLALTSFLVSIWIGPRMHTVPDRLLIGGGLALIGVADLLDVVLLTSGASWVHLLPGMALTGVGAGLALPTFSSAAMRAVPPQRGGMAAGAVSTVRQLGFAVGVAVLGSLFARFAADYLATAGERHVGSVANGLGAGQAQVMLAHAGSGRAALDHALHEASIHGLDAAFLVAGIVGIVAAVGVWILMRPARAT